VLTGAGCNVVAVTGGGRTLLIDGGREEHSEALLDAVAALPDGGPVHTPFNTSWRAEYRGTNLPPAAAAPRIVAHPLAPDSQPVRGSSRTASPPTGSRCASCTRGAAGIRTRRCPPRRGRTIPSAISTAPCPRASTGA